VLFSPALPAGVVREGVRLGTMLAMTVLSLATTQECAPQGERVHLRADPRGRGSLRRNLRHDDSRARDSPRSGRGVRRARAVHFYWLSGALSSFLDKRPDVSDVRIAGARACTKRDRRRRHGGAVRCRKALLAAISCGSVMMGANSYIGNGPNFMVKAIAEEQGVPMPSFFGYMVWSCGILLPLSSSSRLIFFPA